MEEPRTQPRLSHCPLSWYLQENKARAEALENGLPQPVSVSWQGWCPGVLEGQCALASMTVTLSAKLSVFPLVETGKGLTVLDRQLCFPLIATWASFLNYKSGCYKPQEKSRSHPEWALTLLLHQGKHQDFILLDISFLSSLYLAEDKDEIPPLPHLAYRRCLTTIYSTQAWMNDAWMHELTLAPGRASFLGSSF